MHAKAMFSVMVIACFITLICCIFTSQMFANSESPQENANLSKATFAGGCFWCMQHAFDGIDGVVSTAVGYTGGLVEDPTYEEVSSGGTGHAETLQIHFDPKVISYDDLLQIFWHNIDPTVKDQQFCDKGAQYRSAIYYHDAEQKRLAERSKEELVTSKRFENVYTEIVSGTVFYIAEEYHQHYYKKNPYRYKLYVYFCGREQRLSELWGEVGNINE